MPRRQRARLQEMRSDSKFLFATLLFRTLTLVSVANAQERIPDFSPAANIAWQSRSPTGLDPAVTGPQPVKPDPVVFKDHQYDMDTDFPVLDVSNPNLLPWVAERLKTQNERVLAGKPLQPVSASCWPHGL